MEIKLTKGFFIEPDEMNVTLKQRYVPDGKDYESIKTISYHRTMEQAVERYLKMVQLSVSPEKAVTLREYVKMVTKENRVAIKAIKDLLENK